MQNRNHSDGTDPQGRALWHRAQAGFAASEAGNAAPDPLLPDALQLAAYLDGRLDEGERDAVEALLAATPRALDAFLSADAALGATLAPPERLVARAAALVPGEALRLPGRAGLLLRLFGKPAVDGRFRLQPALLGLTLAAILVLSVAGFEIGRFGYAVAADQEAASISTAMAELDGLGLSPDTAY